MSTIFHAIMSGDIPAEIVFENDRIIGFKDIAPNAAVHVLFVPRETIPTLNDASPEHATLLGELMLAAAAYARSIHIAENGYRVVMNCNGDAGQTVFQVHLHLLGGEPLGSFGAGKS